MDHYLFTARSITHAQRMAQALERSGVYMRISRIGAGFSSNGCGYALEVPARQFHRAASLLKASGVLPVKAFFVSNGQKREVAL
ncbi:MAG: DUF3343 domain-containing protein [Oscillospiraceae bacterium]|nr:DUF3343 domain-containing protein [Oscillospiraceae bacterium]